VAPTEAVACPQEAAGRKPAGSRTGRSTSAPWPQGYFDKPLPCTELLDHIWPQWTDPLKQCWVRTVADSKPNNPGPVRYGDPANGEVFVFRHDAPAAGTRELPYLVVIGVPQRAFPKRL
jgi:hypothetical protein